MTRPGKHATREQMPGLLGRFDDPYGITWRVANAIRRVDPARTARFALAWLNPRPLLAPIFIVGMPRSGTQLLFHVLRESGELGGMPREGHDAWRAYHHPRRWEWRGDRVRAGQVQPGESRFLTAWFRSYCGERRLVEKTADNLVRIPYLLELFPDATFIVMKRNPCDVLNSYINMWRQPEGRFRSYFVPIRLQIPGYPHEHRWCSTLVEGWKEMTASPIPEIALAQWREYVSCLEEARRLVRPENWLELSFEGLLADPGATLATVCDRTGLRSDAAMDAKLSELVANPINTLTPPGHEKWRTQNAEEVRALLTRVAGPARVLGYELDPVTGRTD
jgi:hypothetical protein